MGMKVKESVLKVRQLLCLQEAVHYGSISKAADKNGMKQSNLSVQIKDLEDTLGEKLITRLSDGISLTEAGTEIYTLSCDLSTILNKVNTAKLKAFHVGGAIRFWTSDGLGGACISQSFPAFYEKYPNVHIELLCSLDMPKPDQFDLALVYERPTNRQLKIVTEKRLHFGLFAAKSYLEKYGYPKSMKDLEENHRLCGRDTYALAWPKWAQILERAAFVTAMTNSSSMLLQLVKDGIGISLLPVCVGCKEPDLVCLSRLKADFEHKIWLVVRQDVQHLDKIKALSDFMKDVSAKL
jgi:DNA-binding transcriptional LysR family regulator